MISPGADNTKGFGIGEHVGIFIINYLDPEVRAGETIWYLPFADAFVEGGNFNVTFVLDVFKGSSFI